MNWRQLWNAGKQLVTRGLQQIETKVKEWTKPAPEHPVKGVLPRQTVENPESIPNDPKFDVKAPVTKMVQGFWI